MRDRAIQLAKTNIAEAMVEAKKEQRAWYRAQAYAHILRYTDTPLQVLKLAKNAAKQGSDKFQQSAVRAWEISALVHIGMIEEANKSLNDALKNARHISQAGSRAEAFVHLFQAAYEIDRRSAKKVYDSFSDCCDGENGHWRCKRAMKWMREALSKNKNSWD